MSAWAAWHCGCRAKASTGALGPTEQGCPHGWRMHVAGIKARRCSLAARADARCWSWATASGPGRENRARPRKERLEAGEEWRESRTSAAGPELRGASWWGKGAALGTEQAGESQSRDRGIKRRVRGSSWKCQQLCSQQRNVPSYSGAWTNCIKCLIFLLLKGISELRLFERMVMFGSRSSLKIWCPVMISANYLCYISTYIYGVNFMKEM
jgi:hypothetical protein